jgi:hypothetical protein
MNTMNIPGFTAEASLSEVIESYKIGRNIELPAGNAGVVPQACLSTGCLGLPSGRFCVNLPIFGRRCVNIPSTGRWRLRCCTRWGFPPFSCSVSRC